MGILVYINTVVFMLFFLAWKNTNRLNFSIKTILFTLFVCNLLGALQQFGMIGVNHGW